LIEVLTFLINNSSVFLLSFILILKGTLRERNAHTLSSMAWRPELPIWCPYRGKELGKKF